MVASLYWCEDSDLSMEQQVKDWLSIKENQQKVAEIHKNLPRVPDEPKSLQRAEEFRKNGNQSYTSCKSQQDLHNVYECYVKSIAYSPANSKEIALSYGNLSAVLFRLKKISQCLEAIDYCLNLDYPEESKIKIYLRKIECLKIIDEAEKAKEVYDQTLAWIETKEQKVEMKGKLEDCFNKQVKIRKPLQNEDIDKLWKKFGIKKFSEEIPGVSNAIRLEYEESQGRHYVAKRDIKPGEILIKDRPYAVLGAMKSRYRCCWECCKSLTNCIACDFCEQVIFCSQKCKEKAWEEYHHVECKLLPVFFNQPKEIISDYADNLTAAFRVLVKAVKEYGSIEELRKAFEDVEPSADPRTEGFSEGRLVVDKYAGFMSLKSHFKHFEVSFLTYVTAIIYHVASTTTLLGQRKNLTLERLSGDKDLIFAICAFIRHVDIVNANRTNVKKNYDWTGHTGMTSLSIPANFLNHSCVANVFTVQTKEYTKIVAFRPIKKGEQVLLHYLGDAYYNKEDKQKVLQSKHNLSCNCVACVNDWPDYEGYPDIDDLPVRNAMNVLTVCAATSFHVMAVQETGFEYGYSSRMDFKFMAAIVPRFSEAIQGLVGNVPEPCAQIFDLQSSMLAFCMKLHSAFM